MDQIKWYHKNCAECVKHRVTCALCRREERIWQPRNNAKFKHVGCKEDQDRQAGDYVMVTVPDLDRTKIDA